MKNVLSTAEMKNIITNTIIEKIPEAQFYIENLIRFRDINSNQAEPGLYLFSRLGSYRIVYVGDRCDVLDEIETDDLREVLWCALNPIIFNIAVNYEVMHRKKKRGLKWVISKIKKEKYDCRRIIFAKKIELYGLFGENFKKRKQKEIDKILLNSPYVD